MKKRFLAALSLMLIAIVGVSCSGSDSGVETASSGLAEERGAEKEQARALTSGSNEMAAADTAAGTGSGSGGSGAGGGDTATGTVYDTDAAARQAGLPDLGLRVIKSATVSLEIGDDDLQQTLQNATSTAEKYGGFVVSTTVSENDDEPTGAIVVRIPATRFGDALTDLESLGKVTSENVSGQDVTQEFIDLEARLRNYVAQETVLLRLMDRAQSVTDTIRVQNELQRVQLEIERLRGRITYLEDQTSMSTIELRVAEEGAVAAPPGEFEKAWERAKDGLVAVVAGLIASLGVVLPIGLLTLLVIFVVMRLRPRVGSQAHSGP